MLGNCTEELVGELTLYGSFLAFALALYRKRLRRVALLGAVTGRAGWIGMFWNMTPSVQLAADVTNVLLPLFLIVPGVALLRTKYATVPR